MILPADLLLDHLVPGGPVHLVGDDTVDGHPGRAVYGKARHWDPAHSTHSYTAWRYGHRWVALAVLVRFPLATRPSSWTCIGRPSRTAPRAAGTKPRPNSCADSSASC